MDWGLIIAAFIAGAAAIATLLVPTHPPAKRPDSLDEYYASLQGRDDENS